MNAATVTAAPLLEARGLYAGYQGVPAVHDLNLRVHPGEVVALLGPNGAGKTTTLMTLAGALAQISGSVLLDGSVANQPLHRRVRRGLALLTEQRAIAMTLTTLDNLKLGASQSELALELFPELKPRLRVRAGQLSGGEQQMLALARILSSQPRVLLADEVSLGLSPVASDRLFDAVRSAADGGLAVLLVEQMVDRALAIADRAVVIVRGRVRLESEASALSDDVSVLSELYFD